MVDEPQSHEADVSEKQFGTPTFLSGGGDMGSRIRALDWANTPLGPVHAWPAALRTTLRILLSTKHPAFLFWGPDSLCLYNDAYSLSIGPEKHPSMLGMPARRAWNEIWPIVGPQIEQVMAGRGATWHENQLIPITRNGRLEQVYWTYGYNPVDDDTAPGGIGGVLVLCTETSQQVHALQRSQADQAHWLSLFDQAPGFICVLVGPEHRYEYCNSRYRELVAQRSVVGRTVLECLPEVEEQGFIALLNSVYASGKAYIANDRALWMDVPDQLKPVLHHVDFVYQPIRDSNDQVTGIFIEGHDVSQRAQALTGLRLTLESMTDAFMALDNEWRYIYLNPAAEALFDLRLADVLGCSYWDLLSPGGNVPLGDEFRRAAAGEPSDFEYLQVARGRWLRLRCYPRDVGGLVVYGQDITERRQAEDALRLSEQRARERAEELEAVMASMPAIIWIAQDRECTQITGNPRSYQLLGMQEGDNPSATPTDHTQAQTRPFTEYINGRPADPQDLPLQRAAATGHAVPPMELTFVFRDGSERHLFGGAAPLRDDQGTVRGAVGAFVEITELKRAQAGLQQRERELRSLADNTPDVLVRFDRQHRHLFVNAAIERASGLRPHDLIGRSAAEFGMPAQLVALRDEALRQVFATGQAMQMEFTVNGPGDQRVYSARLVPESADGMGVESVLAIVQDVTDQRRAEQAMNEAERRKDEFLATLAHELRNPLAPLRTGLQVLDRGGDGAATKRVRAMMQRQLSQMVRLIDDLLDVSRIATGKLTLRCEMLSLQTVAEMAVEASRPALEAGHHRLRLQLAAEPVWIHADLTRLAQVAGNLLNNAAKYTAQGGDITLSVAREGEQAVLCVVDNGMGIPPDLLEEVFQMFAQVNSTLQRAQGGLGIGLALARSIVVLHEGRITAHSEGLGRGSVFTVRLPVVQQAKVAELCAPEPAGGVPATDVRKVLVVDDNRDAADSLALLLGLWGHDVRTAYGGVEGLRVAQAWLPDVAFVDIGMPGLNGYDLARSLRQQGASTVLVALTGWGTQQDEALSRDAGFDLHLTKPAAIDAVEAVLKQLP